MDTIQTSPEFKSKIDELARNAIGIATNGAVKYLQAHNLRPRSSDELVAAIKREVEKALPEALEDAKAALDIGMKDVGALTFSASMVNAGIAAAKESI